MMGNMGNPPIFVGGAGRSGTTLLRVILDTHSHIACGPEFKAIPMIAEQWACMLQLFPAVLSEYHLGVEDISNSYRGLIESLLNKYRTAQKKNRIAEKSPNNVFYFSHLHRMFPQSPLIHVIRDGRDVVSSLLTMNWIDPASGKKLPYVETARGAAEYWVRAVETGRNAAKKPNIGSRYFEIKYEDIVEKSEETLRRLFLFLEEPWEAEVLDFHKEKRNLAKESSASQVSQKLYSSSMGRWKTDLKPEDKQTVKQIAGKLLIELGYASDCEW